MNNEDKSIAVCVCLGLLLLFGLLFGMFVYNHGQNISRDEFYATHCKYVSKVDNSDDFSGTKYLCEGAK